MEKPRNRPIINPTHKQNNGRPRMTELVILGTSIVTPPYHSSSAPHHNHHHHSPKSKFRNPNSSPKTLLSTQSKAIPTAHHKSSAPPILSTVRWNHRNSSSLLTHYASLASKLAGDGRLEDLTMVAESVIASGVDPSHFVAALNVSLVATGVAKNLREGNVRHVVEVLQKVDQLGIPALKLVDEVSMELLKRECVKIANCGDVDAIVELMETLQGFGFSIKELVDPYRIIKICIEKCNPVVAVRYACILPHDRVLFCNIVSEFGRKRNLDSALIAYEAFKQELGRPNMYLYRTIIDACGLCGDYMKSREIYEDLLDQKVIPNVYVFNSLMNVNAQDLSYTLTVYKSMQNLGVVADVASYNILLKACCLAGRVNMAQDIYREVKQLESTGSLKLDVFTYCTIITVFADAKLWQMALKVKEDMLSSGVTPNSFTWSSLISACANAGLVEQAMQLFKEMLLSGCEPNSHCCNIILHACVEGRQYDRAFRHFKSWKRGEFMETFGAECSNRAENIEFTHKKFHFTPTSTTYNILMKACGSDYQRAKALMDEMKTAGISPNHISWSVLIDISGGSGNLVGAVQTLKNMRAAGVKPDVVAYTTAIKVCVESKRLKQAFSLFAEMKRYQIKPNLVSIWVLLQDGTVITKQKTLLPQHVITYNTLLRARARYGSLQEVQQCLSIYQDMRKAGYKSNDYYLKQLIEEWCEGVIQGNDLSQGPHPSYKRTDLGRTHGLLLEKVAAHLQNSIAESLTINLQGMSKVEARIVVLAVLRRIKENYAAGLSVKDDMWITLGADEVTEKEPEVKDAILKLLQIELGLDVQCLVPKLTGETDTNLPNHLNSDSDRLERNSKLVSSARRPTVLERIKVTRISLDRWLQRRVGSLKR